VIRVFFRDGTDRKRVVDRLDMNPETFDHWWRTLKQEMEGH
jgi:transposase-like protein